MIRLPLLICLLVFNTLLFACDFGSDTPLTLETEFAGGLNRNIKLCTANKAGTSLHLTVKPENSPINDSPWYAFKLSSKVQQTVNVAMLIEDGNHRYPPKLSKDGKTWQPVNHTIKNDELRFEINVDSKPVWIAAQEIITSQDYIHWGEKLAEQSLITRGVIGRSVQGRPVYALATSSPDTRQWLVLIGRQHPPEVTGALALFPFVSTVLADSELANNFRQYFNIAIIPNLNPDGVDLGYWRHNVNGVDLNRDWKTFKQPEVKAVHDYLTNIAKNGGKIAMAVDFHSTNEDLFYTIPDDYDIESPYLISNWLNELDRQYPDFEVIQQPGSQSGRPVFQQYIADYYKVPAVTYEVGDNTDRQFIKKLATSAANILMQTMLAPLAPDNQLK